VKLAAPAKVNLFLEVPARRPDGFHELDTVFCALDLADEVEVDPLPAGRLEVAVAGDPTVPTGPENLVWRAAAALRDEAGRPDLGARIAITKRIPAGGGLGGGSSDAAAALRALDRVWGLDVGAERLAALAARLGSDVAFFLAAGVQRGRGRGELLEPLPPPPRPLELVLLLPGFACPTPRVYGALAPFLPARPRPAEPLVEALASGDPTAVGAALFNRLEEPARAEFPRLEELAQTLRAQPGLTGVLLSGSGSTLFGVAAGPGAAADAAAALGRRGLRTRTARTAGGAS